MTPRDTAPVLVVVARGTEFEEFQSELAARKGFKLRGAGTTAAVVNLLKSLGDCAGSGRR